MIEGAWYTLFGAAEGALAELEGAELGHTEVVLGFDVGAITVVCWMTVVCEGWLNNHHGLESYTTVGSWGAATTTTCVPASST